VLDSRGDSYFSREKGGEEKGKKKEKEDSLMALLDRSALSA